MEERLSIAVGFFDWKSQVVSKQSISDLINQIEKGTYRTKEIEIDLNTINIQWYWFTKADSLFEFMVHYKMIENADLSFPVIVDYKWHIVDGRHRLAKAILTWQKTIKAIQILEQITALEIE